MRTLFYFSKAVNAAILLCQDIASVIVDYVLYISSSPETSNDSIY